MTKKIPNFYQKRQNQTSTKIEATQMPQWILDVIKKQVEEFNGNLEVEKTSVIPHTDDIPLNISRWLQIPDVVCVFVDMKNSTKLSASIHERSTSRAYQLFTGTAVRLFDAFEAPYIDVKGDGVFALFNSNQVYRALSAAVSFKTFTEEIFTPTIQKITNLPVGSHIGIDQKTILVRKLGLKRIDGRTDRQNEVWAGKTVNMASKLASIGEAGDLLVSERFYNRITDEYVRMSCGCPNEAKAPLWSSVDLTENPIFDFTTAFRLRTRWCKKHGAEFCNTIYNLDSKA
jgi:class 3 adenylate cyclase